MKGLIIKDLLGLKQISVTMGLLMVFYLFLGFMSKGESDGQMTYFSIMALVINLMVPITCAGYDEQCGWDQFGASLPVGKKAIVASRYIIGLIVIGFTTLVVFAANIIFKLIGGTPSGLISYFIPIVISMVYIAVMTPIIYKFGVQKSRFIIILVAILPSLLFSFLIVFFISSRESPFLSVLDTAGSLISDHAVAFTVGSFAAACLLYALSMLLSTKIYMKKEL